MAHLDEHPGARARICGALVAAAVVVAHGVALYLVMHHSTTSLNLESGRPAEGAVSVRLIAAPTVVPPAPEVQKQPPKPTVIEKPAPKPPIVKKARVISSEAPSTRSVQVDQPKEEKPVVETPPPAPAVATAPTAAPAQQAMPAKQESSSNMLSEPKQISAGELKQLGCQIPRPEYPAKAKRLEQEGTVVVKLTVGIDGVISGATVAQSSGSPLLDAAALASIRSGRCRPYTADGAARAVEATQPIAFNLND